MWEQQPDVGAASLLLLRLEGEAQLPASMWGVEGGDRGKAAWARLTICCVDLKEDPLCLEHLRRPRDRAGASHKLYIPLKKRSCRVDRGH